MKRIIVVGGGAGGLELVSHLSRHFGKSDAVQVTLVDRCRTHIWKPLLHEVAAGVIDKHSDGVEYGMHASMNGYEFQLGNMSDIDTERRQITLDALIDDNGEVILPSRQLDYDYLVLAVGSVSNDFGTPGVSDYCYMLDSLAEAEKFHRALINQLLKVNASENDKAELHVAIVGGGATGTELAAQLHHIANLARAYGMPKMSAQRLKVTILEAGERILPALPERIAASARQALSKLSIDVKEGCKVVEADEQGFVTGEDSRLDADLMVWAAGVKAPPMLADMGAFETNRVNQILVRDTLQSTRNDEIFVIGDCCGVQRDDGSWVPPRAQSAHQMAETVNDNLRRALNDKPLKAFTYRDYGSLVHLSKYSTVGSLMGSLANSSMFVEGRLARLVYKSLYNMHQFAVHGYIRGMFKILSRKVGNAVSLKLKLH
ncbi:NAD(P)/FAD-dependent oxidoreductase [Alteromonas halophila]|uniref:NADH dehydrogenase n=1 Tax=Alteromonas halophila TaxID=516698 RepID=A0A918JGV4_9ALTE|nr:NAD(P)/FAD-dependent oxidoreductase [Alteromonas halophila]GGW78006.1 NADH dehydrogenase [Alteromonas halophila]